MSISREKREGGKEGNRTEESTPILCKHLQQKSSGGVKKFVEVFLICIWGYQQMYKIYESEIFLFLAKF
jgi:hypothetical protein